MANDQKLAGLPEDVREAVVYLDRGGVATVAAGAWATIRAELLRLARENAELRRAKDTLALIAGDHGRALGNALDRAERAESELAELRRKNARLHESALTGYEDGWHALRNERDALKAELAALKARIAASMRAYHSSFEFTLDASTLYARATGIPGEETYALVKVED